MTIEKPVIYEVILFNFEKMTNLLPIKEEQQIADICLELMHETVTLNKFNFQLLDNMFVYIHDLYAVFGYRLIRLMKNQFDIGFMRSDKYDKERQMSFQTATKHYFKSLVKYLCCVFEQLHIEQIYFVNKQHQSGYNYTIHVNGDLMVSQKLQVRSVPDDQLKQIRKLIGIVKKPISSFLGDVTTSCKDKAIRSCFTRNYSDYTVNHLYSQDLFQQLILDYLVQIVYKYFENINFVTNATWTQINNEYKEDVLSVLQGKRCLARDALIQVVDIVLNKMTEWEKSNSD
ncbi:Hypothetical_protein [Hexamita inflata]|uniref:Hypothetical_protein n=1 Tax=Hexamita inflata TaxID=28002 RepID=A0AA86V0D1_9EUKA|nr:Hypothetical protein HINF_LOCUS58967 [Hexamita inflata]